MLEYAERILALSEEMDTRVADLTGRWPGRCCSARARRSRSTSCREILGEFKAAHPEVQAQLTVANSETIVNRVADHTLDVGLIESPSYLPTLQNEVCCEDELVVICAPRPSAREAEDGARPGARGAARGCAARPARGRASSPTTTCAKCGVAPDDLNVMMELGSPEAMKGVVETGHRDSRSCRARRSRRSSKLGYARRRSARAAADPHALARASAGEVPLAPA